MLTLAVPLLVIVTVCDCFAPTATLPKASLAGVSPSRPPSVVAVPESERFGTAFEAVLVTLAVALKVPPALGVNLTVNEAL